MRFSKFAGLAITGLRSPGGQSYVLPWTLLLLLRSSIVPIHKAEVKNT
jgi:hypothetical protein